MSQNSWEDLSFPGEDGNDMEVVHEIIDMTGEPIDPEEAKRLQDNAPKMHRELASEAAAGVFKQILARVKAKVEGAADVAGDIKDAVHNAITAQMREVAASDQPAEVRAYLTGVLTSLDDVVNKAFGDSAEKYAREAADAAADAKKKGDEVYVAMLKMLSQRHGDNPFKGGPFAA